MAQMLARERGLACRARAAGAGIRVPLLRRNHNLHFAQFFRTLGWG